MNSFKGTKTENICKILLDLLSGKKVYVKSLKDDYGLKDRTIRNYKSFLSNFFADNSDRYTLYTGKENDNKEKYWYLEHKNTFSPKIESNENGDFKKEFEAIDNIDRIIGLHLTISLLKKIKIYDVNKIFTQIWSHLIDTIKNKKDIENTLRNIGKIFYFLWYAPKEFNGDILQNIVHGILHKKVLRCRYVGLNYDRQYTILIKPISLIFYQGLLYLLAAGAKRGHKAIRTYAVDRIESLEITGKKFKFNYDRFDPSDHINKYIGVITGKSRKKFELLFKNDPVLKRLIKERKWFENQTFDELEDGRLRMKFTTYPTVEVKRWILSYGDEVKVIHPKGFLNMR